MTEQASKKPVANPTAAVPAVLFALVLIAAGVVLGREALLKLGALDGSEWVGPAASNLDGLTAQQWMLPAGIAAVVIGFVLVFVAIRPRRRTHRALTEQGVWLRKGDVAAVARSPWTVSASTPRPPRRATRRSPSPYPPWPVPTPRL